MQFVSGPTRAASFSSSSNKGWMKPCLCGDLEITLFMWKQEYKLCFNFHIVFFSISKFVVMNVNKTEVTVISLLPLLILLFLVLLKNSCYKVKINPVSQIDLEII